MLKAGFAVGCTLLPTVFAQVGWRPRVDLGPDAPAHAAMAYDEARGTLVLFGGVDRIGRGASSSTWEWSNGKWTLRHGPSPLVTGRYGHAMAYDPVRQRVVAFGGFDRLGNPLDDTWLWDGTTWVPQVTASRPSARGYARLAFHAAAGGLVLFGGGRSAAALLDETWVLTAAGWTMLNPASRPPARWGCGLVSDTARGRLVLFGGYVPAAANDTWEWDGVTWLRRSPAVAPAAAEGPALCYDAVRRRTLLSVADVRAENATWEWDGQTWVERLPARAPSRRTAHTMAFDSLRQRVVLFGEGDKDLSTWEWDGATWVALAAQIPGRRTDSAIAHHPPSRTSILFGGYSVAQSGFGMESDTWAWNGTVWRLAATAGPRGRMGHALAYDAATERVVLFGGMDLSTGSMLNDAWSWDGAAWSASPGGPSGRYAHALAAHGAGLVLFGGDYAGLLFDDTWEFRAGNWRPIVASVRPSARRDHAMASDGVRLILFGGFDGVAVQGDTWAYTSTGWQRLAPAQAPPPRRRHRMVYDAARARVVLFGGDDGAQRFDDVWEWDGTTWEQRGVPLIAIPGVRSGHALVYDSDRRNVVLYGGEGGNALQAAWTDTWTYQTARPASFSNFGVPCPGSPRIAAETLPWLGDTFVLNVTAIFGGGALLWGTSRTSYRGQPLPIDLTPLGLTGCALLVSPDAIVMIPASYQWQTPLPRDSSLVGRRLFLQTVVQRPGANPAGLVTSDGAEIVFGLR